MVGPWYQSSTSTLMITRLDIETFVVLYVKPHCENQALKCEQTKRNHYDEPTQHDIAVEIFTQESESNVGIENGSDKCGEVQQEQWVEIADEIFLEQPFEKESQQEQRNRKDHFGDLHLR